MRARTLIALLVFGYLFCAPGVPVAHADTASSTNTVITSDTTFAPGTYTFDTLTVASTSTLTLGDPTGQAGGAGVTIHARNLMIEPGSALSAYATGYPWSTGPGAPVSPRAGASYGGVGGANTATSTYDSALDPHQPGSSGDGSGGGAITLVISDTLINDGTIAADGQWSASGGSINVRTGTLAGSGMFSARGGGKTSSSYRQPGGGGRIAIRYAASSFSGVFTVAGGQSSYGSGGPGTLALIDTTTDTLILPDAFRFERDDSPVSFGRIDVTGTVSSVDDVSVHADAVTITDQGAVSFGKGLTFDAARVALGGHAVLSFSDTSGVTVGAMTLSDDAVLTTVRGYPLTLSLESLSVGSGARVDVSGKGYDSYSGPGAPTASYQGASYGGIGYGNTATSTYGDARSPTDFGSGAYGPGGGVITLTVTGTLVNDGTIAADGQWSGSGGSVLIRAGVLGGAGVFSANGAGKTTVSSEGPGGGGRVALFSAATSTWSGAIQAAGACNWSVGTRYCASAGTVVVDDGKPKHDSVLFLPGIEGSRLYEGTGCGGDVEEKLWEPASSIFDFYKGNAHVAALGLDDSGKSTCTDIYTKAGDIVDSVYQPLEDQMDGLVAGGTIAAWEPVAYDWRLSIDDVLTKGAERDGKIYYEDATTTPYLEQTLRALARSSQTGRVTIVAHSNGGLVAKALLQKLESTAPQLVDRLILVGSPQDGTPSALGSLLVGYSAGIYQYGVIPIVSNAAARTLARNAPMAYHLLPSAAYVAAAGNDAAHPLVSFAGSDYQKAEDAYGPVITSFAQLTDFLLAAGGDRDQPDAGDLYHAMVANPTLLGYAARMHDELDAWTPPAGIEVDQVAGWGAQTVAGIDFYTPTLGDRGAACVSCALEPEYRPTFVEDGDGTVTTPSALMMASNTQVKRYWVDLLSFYKDKKVRVAHADIFKLPEIREFITNLLEDVATLPAYISLERPPANDTTKTLTYFLHSPLTLEVSDSAGNTTGLAPDGTVNQDIPGSRYGVFGEVKYVSVPAGSAYTVALHGQGDGTFSLDVQEQTGSAVTQTTTIAGVPVTRATKATLSTAADGALSALIVDEAGDGKNVLTITPRVGETVPYVPPDTTTPSAPVVAPVISPGSISIPVITLPSPPRSLPPLTIPSMRASEPDVPDPSVVHLTATVTRPMLSAPVIVPPALAPAPDEPSKVSAGETSETSIATSSLFAQPAAVAQAVPRSWLREAEHIIYTIVEAAWRAITHLF